MAGCPIVTHGHISHSRTDLQYFDGYNISSSNWILMSTQPHRVTSRQSNSGHSKYTFLSSSHIHINPLSSQSTKPQQPWIPKSDWTPCFSGRQVAATRSNSMSDLVELLLIVFKCARAQVTQESCCPNLCYEHEFALAVSNWTNWYSLSKLFHRILPPLFNNLYQVSF